MRSRRLLRAVLALFALLGSAAAPAQTLSGSIHPGEIANALSAFGPAEVVRTDDTVVIIGSFPSSEGVSLAYRAPLASCLDGKACGNLSLRYFWTGNDQVWCIINAWRDRYDGEDRARPVFAFEEIRLFQEIFAYGNVAVDPVLIAQNWHRDLLAFDALTRQADKLCS